MGHIIHADVFCYAEQIMKGLAECGMEISVQDSTKIDFDVRHLPRAFAVLDSTPLR